MKIKIVASFPQDGQAGIEGLIGKEVNANTVYEEGIPTQKVKIDSEEFGGNIILNPGEFVKV